MAYVGALSPAFAQSGGDGSKHLVLEALLEEIRAEYRVPALAIAVVHKGDIVAAAVGLRRAGCDKRVRLDDLFHVGSVSKPISATVIAILVESGVLQWDTTISQALPDLSDRILPDYRHVTLEQLLSHRAGIVPWEEDEEIAQAPAATGTPRQQRESVLQWLLTRRPVAQPGTEFVYSNAGYLVASALAEAATDRAWEDLVVERLAKPAGLHSLGFGWPAREDASQPWGHRAVPEGFVPHDLADGYKAGPWLGPAGDMHLDIVDLARFAQLHLDGLQGKPTLLTATTYRKLHQAVGDYGLGWNVRETFDHHLGGLGTFLAAIWVSVPRDTAIVTATNADADPKIVSAVIGGALRVLEIPKPSDGLPDS